MGTVRRLKDEKDKLKAAENAVPGAYEDRYTGQVNDQLSAMGAKNDAGLDYDTVNEAFQQYKANAARNAQNGAAAAAATAQSLAGGYGADWANSVTGQTAANQTAAAGTSLADLRSRALQQWQNELSGENNLVDTLLGQEGVERSTAAMNTGAAQNWRDYLASRVGQARQENSDFWGNVWNGAVNVGNALLQGYDAYKGYEYQQQQLAMQKKAMENEAYNTAWNLFDQGREQEARQYLKNNGLDDSLVDSWVKSDATQHSNADWNYGQLDRAMGYQQAGYGTAADQTAASGGFDSGVLGDWQGIDDPTLQKMQIIQTGSELAGSGNDTAADSYLKLGGVGTDSIDHYSTVAGRQNQANLNYLGGQLKLQNQYKTTGSSGSRSGTSAGSSGKSGSTGSSGNTQQTQSRNTHGYTDSQLLNMSKTYQSMSKTDPQRPYYKQVLTDAGFLQADGTPGTSAGSSTQRLSYGQNVVNTGLASGKSQSAIMDQLFNQGFSDAEIAEFFNKAK